MQALDSQLGWKALSQAMQWQNEGCRLGDVQLGVCEKANLPLQWQGSELEGESDMILWCVVFMISERS
jgi:hypothetical protein